MAADQHNSSDKNLGSLEEGQQLDSSADDHGSGGPLETNTGVGGSDANVGAGSEVEGGAANDVVRPKNSQALGGLGSGPGSTPDMGTHDLGSGSQGGSSGASGPAAGVGAPRTGDNGNTGEDGGDLDDGGLGGESGADMGSGSGGSTGETIGTP